MSNFLEKENVSPDFDSIKKQVKELEEMSVKPDFFEDEDNSEKASAMLDNLINTFEKSFDLDKFNEISKMFETNNDDSD